MQIRYEVILNADVITFAKIPTNEQLVTPYFVLVPSKKCPRRSV